MPWCGWGGSRPQNGLDGDVRRSGMAAQPNSSFAHTVPSPQIGFALARVPFAKFLSGGTADQDYFVMVWTEAADSPNLGHIQWQSSSFSRTSVMKY